MQILTFDEHLSNSLRPKVPWGSWPTFASKVDQGGCHGGRIPPNLRIWDDRSPNGIDICRCLRPMCQPPRVQAWAASEKACGMAWIGIFAQFHALSNTLDLPELFFGGKDLGACAFSSTIRISLGCCLCRHPSRTTSRTSAYQIPVGSSG